MSTKSRTEAILYGAALVLAVAGGAWAIARHVAGTEAEPAERATASAPSEEEAIDPPEPEPDIAPPVLPEVPDLAAEPPPPPPENAGDPRFDHVAEEMRMLSRARDLIAEHPSEALGALEEHRRAHPAGVLREEREAFAIEALMALDYSAEAERRYYEFMHDYPHSDFAPRLRELMR